MCNIAIMGLTSDSECRKVMAWRRTRNIWMQVARREVLGPLLARPQFKISIRRATSCFTPRFITRQPTKTAVPRAAGPEYKICLSELAIPDQHERADWPTAIPAGKSDRPPSGHQDVAWTKLLIRDKHQSRRVPARLLPLRIDRIPSPNLGIGYV